MRRTEGAIELVPEEPLALGGTYALALGAFAEDAERVPIGGARVWSLAVATEDAGAVVLETWPAAGSYGVPPAIDALAIRFDDLVEGLGGITLRDADGALVEATVTSQPCIELMLGPGFCVALVPEAEIAEHATYRLEVGTETVDRTSAPVGPYVAELTTGGASDLLDAPSLVPLECALDEQAVDGACVLPLEVTLGLRGRAGGPARIELVAGEARMATSAPRGDFELLLEGIAPGAMLNASITLYGLDGQALALDLPLQAAEDLARVFITEVRADPAGPEPDQEYVEIHNAGERAVDLTGFTLSDDASKAGDEVPGPATLPAGGYALLVPQGFDPNATDDAPVPPGVPLFRLDGSLGSGGLTNGGEPLFLRDASGRRASAAPALGAPDKGVCIVRVATDGRTGAEGSFAPHPEGGCGPGRPDR
jgi:hypothetical protein